MTITQKTEQPKQKQAQPDDIERAMTKYLAGTKSGRYKIIYDEPTEHMQPLFDILTASGWQLNAVVPGYSFGDRCFPVQFIFERKRSGVLDWTMLIFTLFCAIALLCLLFMHH